MACTEYYFAFPLVFLFPAADPLFLGRGSLTLQGFRKVRSTPYSSSLFLFTFTPTRSSTSSGGGIRIHNNSETHPSSSCGLRHRPGVCAGYNPQVDRLEAFIWSGAGVENGVGRYGARSSSREKKVPWVTMSQGVDGNEEGVGILGEGGGGEDGLQVLQEAEKSR